MESLDRQYWRCHTELQKFEGDIEWFTAPSGLSVPVQDGQIVAPFDVVERDGNVLTIGGASIQWQTLIGNGTTTADQELTFYNNARAAIGVGDSTTSAARHPDRATGSDQPPLQGNGRDLPAAHGLRQFGRRSRASFSALPSQLVTRTSRGRSGASSTAPRTTRAAC